MSEQNKLLVRRAIDEVWNQGDYTHLGELVARDIVIHSSMPGADIYGTEGVKHFYTTLRAAFPDIHFTVEAQIAEGDRVVSRWRADATHTGEYQGIPPTGKQVRLMGIDIDRLANGKVVECWPMADELGLLQQFGVVSTPGQAS